MHDINKVICDIPIAKFIKNDMKHQSSHTTNHPSANYCLVAGHVEGQHRALKLSNRFGLQNG